MMSFRRESLALILPVMDLLWTASFATAFTTPYRGYRTAATIKTSTNFFSATLSDLESMTVKDLKDVLEDSGLNKRGLLSKLKRKQDLIDFLQENLPSTEAEQISDKHSENDAVGSEVMNDSLDPSSLQLSKEIQAFPPPLQDSLARRGVTALLPIQSKAFRHVQEGNDAVIHAPTGSGKTLAFVLPLVARMFAEKDVLKPHAKGKHSSKRNTAVSPRVVTVVPSRELAKQVGKEWAKYCPAPVATVFGGVPMERHTALVRKGGGAHVVVSTPGRLRELVREGHLDFRQVQAVVLDEADTMLDAADSPDVQAILNSIDKAVGEREDWVDQQYQMVLVSATLNSLVRNFAMETMEISLESRAFISVERSDSRMLPDPVGKTESTSYKGKLSAPDVQHWYTSAKTAAYPSVTADLISTLLPRLGIVFVQTKGETEKVSSYLASKLPGITVRALHGDMSQAARSRTISLIRESAKSNSDSRQILVATDVASRGLDLPNVDLVVQFGIPRLGGKEGTSNVELYTHRTGRAGRVQAGKESLDSADQSATAVMLYDPAVGEGKVLDDLLLSVKNALDVTLQHRPIPSSRKIIDSGYTRAVNECLKSPSTNPQLVAYFRNRLKSDDRLHTLNTEELLDNLSAAMVALSNLGELSPNEQRSSLLTGDAGDRTLQVYREDGSPVTPPEVTKFCKTFGSGKIGRCFVADDGSAVFDLPTKRAKRLVSTVQSTEEDTFGWKVQWASQVPEIRK